MNIQNSVNRYRTLVNLDYEHQATLNLFRLSRANFFPHDIIQQILSEGLIERGGREDVGCLYGNHSCITA